MSTVVRVLRAEGVASALRRIRERAGESLELRARLALGVLARDDRAPILNVSGMPPVARLGGLPIQLRARLREEQLLRKVALFHPGVLESGGHARRVHTLEEALQRTAAHTIHLEGTFGMPLDEVLRLPAQILLSLHDVLLLNEPEPVRQELFARARVVIYPSCFLRDLYGVPGLVIEPGSTALSVPKTSASRTRVAYAGSLKRHKGAHLLPEIIRATNAEWHLFGGGDEDILAAVRDLPGVTIHGYHRAGTLPSLLVRHRIGLAVLPSLVTPTFAETFSLALSECWRASVPAVAFDQSALAERIGREGGGWLVPMDEGAAGIARVVRAWMAGELETQVPTRVATPADAAAAHLTLYRSL